MNGDNLRHNPDLDELFGVTQPAKSPDEDPFWDNFDPDREGREAAELHRIGQHAARGAAAVGATATAAAAGGGGNQKPPVDRTADWGEPNGSSPPPPPPPGSNPQPPQSPKPSGSSGTPTVNLAPETVEAIGRAVNGDTEQAQTSSQEKESGKRWKWDREEAQWVKAPRTKEQREKDGEPGRGERTGSKYGGQAGDWIGRMIGAKLGAAGGPAGVLAGEEAGGRIGKAAGEKAGGAVGAVADRVGDVALSPNSENSLERVMPEAAQAVIKWYKELDKATQSIMNNNFQMGHFSAAMGAVAQEQEAAEAFRSKRMGDRLSESAKYLSDNQQERKNNSEGINALSGAVDNYIQGFKEKIVGTIMKPLNSIAEGVNRILGIAEEKADVGLTPEETLTTAAAEADRKFAKADAAWGAMADERR